MGNRERTTGSLIEALVKTESEYFLDRADRHAILVAIKRIKIEFERTTAKFSRKRDTRKMISLFLILERLKKHLVFENFVLSLVEGDLNKLTFSLETLISTPPCDSENTKSSDEIKLGIIQNNTSNCKYEITGFPLKLKNKRANYPKKISKVLKNWLKENMTNPYPSEIEKAMLMEVTGLDATQINNWFINARRRILPYMKSKYIKYD